MVTKMVGSKQCWVETDSAPLPSLSTPARQLFSKLIQLRCCWQVDSPPQLLLQRGLGGLGGILANTVNAPALPKAVCYLKATHFYICLSTTKPRGSLLASTTNNTAHHVHRRLSGLMWQSPVDLICPYRYTEEFVSRSQPTTTTYNSAYIRAYIRASGSYYSPRPPRARLEIMDTSRLKIASD